MHTPIPPLPLMGVWGIWDLWGPLYYQRDKRLNVHLFDANVHLFDANVHLFDANVHLFDAMRLTVVACAPTDRWHNAQVVVHFFYDAVALVRHSFDHLSCPALAVATCAPRQSLATAGCFVDCRIAESDQVSVGKHRIAIGGRVAVSGGLGDVINAIALSVQCHNVRP